jgi:hypothetical protein
VTITRDDDISDRTLAVLGNIQVGAHVVTRYGRRTWFSLGGTIGLPTLGSRAQTQDNYEAPSAANAYWNLHDFFPDIVPVGAHGSFEWHAGLIILRGEGSIVIYAPFGRRNEETEVTVPHAFEIQIGHIIGGGLRLQGVWMPSFTDLDVSHSTEGDLYQLAIEPFLAIERKLGFMRMGLMMPIDERLGPAFERAWGFRLAAGLRIE